MKKAAHYSFPLFLLLFYLSKYADSSAAGAMLSGLNISIPSSHIALSGDLHIQIASSSFPPLILQLSRLEGNIAEPLTTFPVFPEARALSLNSTIAKIPCGYFSRAGHYFVLLKQQPPTGFIRFNSTTTNVLLDNEKSFLISRNLDVRWSMPQLSLTPNHLQTYPNVPVMALLEFPDVVCAPIADNPASTIHEFWLELHYCGDSLLTCDTNDEFIRYNQSKNVQILYTEQVRGFPSRQSFSFNCELFGRAGLYALFLRPTTPASSPPQAIASIKADWSEQFVFNVHARSIFPCDVHNGGITVLFQYPQCIVASKDRVRLFARLRANVASLAPPTSLEYIAEQRIKSGQHSLQFDCDLFTEHYIEYCFVYVSWAITNASTDVRMDCVPTLPVTDFEKGGWGPWSSWTPCSTTCIGGIKSRYRFCDSPPPRYGAKFCEGHAVETEKCGKSLGSGWECVYKNNIFTGDIASEIPEVKSEVGPYCRCGCVVHLGKAKPKRLLATSSQSCPGRTFWLIQADEHHIIQFQVDKFHLPCDSQWLKIRDGSSLSANLLIDLAGNDDASPSLLTIVNSSSSHLLLEFFSDETTAGWPNCAGGFLAYAIQLKPDQSNMTKMLVPQSAGILQTATILKLTAVHVAAIFFLGGLLIATALLGAQYVFRYRKYHMAEAEDHDSLTDQVASTANVSLRTRASSTVTLLSEVISLTRLRPHITLRHKHTRLRESVNCERNNDEEDEEQKVALAKEESISLSSSETLTTQQETLTSAVIPQTLSEMDDDTCKSPQSDDLNKDENDKTSSKISRDSSTISTTTLTHVRPSPEIYPKYQPGLYLPSAGLISTATILTTNAKETKDKRNRQRLLAGPGGSEFSIVGPDADLEMDYYDYNVVNAGAAPGSYLGMDPAFLVWIPPLDDDGEILGDEKHEMDMIKQQAYIDPGSNQESPDDGMLLPKDRGHMEVIRKLSQCDIACDANRNDNEIIYKAEKDLSAVTKIAAVIVKRKSISKSCTSTSTSKLIKDRENETRIIDKSPSIDSNLLEEIKFADDDDDLNENNQCNNNRELSYQDTNILSSNSS